MPNNVISLFSYENLVHAFAGATGSAVAMSAVFPLDIIRTRVQLEPGATPQWTAVVLARLLRDREAGVRVLYGGAAPVLQSLFCSNFVYFYAFHGLKRVTASSSGESGAIFKDLLLAIIAGCVNVLATNPLWVANTRLKMTASSSVAKPPGNRPKLVTAVTDNTCGHVAGTCQCDGVVGDIKQPPALSLWESVCRIGGEEGCAALYRGIVPSLLLTSNPAIQFVAYEAAKRYLHRVRPTALSHSAVVFLVSAACKTLATVLTYPLQLVQAHLRFGGYPRANGVKEHRILKIFALIARRGGVGGLFRGLEAKLLQTVFTAALMFVLYEKIVRLVFRLLLTRGR